MDRIEKPAVETERSYSPGRIAWRKLCRNRLAMFGLVMLILLVLTALLAPVLATHDRDAIEMFAMEKPPNEAHLLGTDDTGRDVFSRLLYGGQVSLSVGLAAVLLQVVRHRRHARRGRRLFRRVY